MKDLYDIAIIGGGPSGLTAGLYACRAGMKTILLEKGICGGQMLIADVIENFPAFPGGAKGPDLAEWMLKQALSFGLETRVAEALEAKPGGLPGAGYSIRLSDKETIGAISVIAATGARWNALGIPGEKELTGRGVSYCATCDGPMFKGKEVVVVGGGDTALGDAVYLTRFASKVTVVHRRDKLRATRILQERAFSNKKIELCLNSVAVSVSGSKKCEGLVVRDVKTDAEKTIACSGVFVLIGLSPNSEIFKGVVSMDEKGYIVCDDDMKTSAPGIFACGDVRKKTLRQVVTAAGDGATAAFSAQHYVEHINGTEYI